MSNANATIAVFDTHYQAEDAVKELQAADFDMKKLSIIGKDFHTEEHPVGFYTTGDRVKTWGGMGAFWGGIWGMILGAAFFWIPGFGPMFAAGPIVHILVSAVEGAALLGGAGALGAALSSLGVPKRSILKYERELRANKYLVIAHGTEQEVARARSILERARASRTEAFAA